MNDLQDSQLFSNSILMCFNVFCRHIFAVFDANYDGYEKRLAEFVVGINSRWKKRSNKCVERL